MDLRSLGVFVEVVQAGGFTAAGKRVFLTQPSISRVIKQLEDEIGQPLIMRHRRRITLTDTGAVVFQRALALRAEADRLKTDVANLSGLTRGQVSLGMPSVGGTLFVPLVKMFRERYPGIELRLFEMSAKATEAALLTNDLDLGTLSLPVDPNRFQFVTLARDFLAVAVPLNSHWAARDSITLPELAKEPLVLLPEGFALSDKIDAASRACGFAPIVAGRSAQSQFIAGLVESGVGIALLPRSVLRGFPSVAAIELREPTIEWHIALAWSRAGHLSHAARAVVEMVREAPLMPI
ncbi:MAG TPA: LysR family transcriptional regulator [Chthoniobacterales bacterium]